MIMEFFEALKILFFPSARIETDIPWSDDKTEVRTEKKEVKEEGARNLHVTKSGLIYEKKDVYTEAGRVIDWDLVNVAADIEDRRPEITEADRRMMGKKVKHPSMEKAALLKPLWAKKISAGDAADSFSERGYGKRTIAEYFSAFNAALSSEEGAERGERCKSMQ